LQRDLNPFPFYQNDFPLHEAKRHWSPDLGRYRNASDPDALHCARYGVGQQLSCVQRTDFNSREPSRAHTDLQGMRRSIIDDELTLYPLTFAALVPRCRAAASQEHQGVARASRRKYHAFQFYPILVSSG